MRLDADGLDDLVILDGTSGAVSVLMTAPLAGLVVSSTGDGADALPGNGLCDDGTGACTLRAAIMEANTLAGADTISFALGAGTPTIAPASALPDITGPISILGNTGGATRVQINGAAAGGSNGLKLAAGSSGSLIRSLVINRSTGSGAGIRIESASNTVEDCWIGLDSSGSTTVAGNAGGGIVISGSAAANNLIGGTTGAARNVISHNSGNGVEINAGAAGNRVQGNYIGTNPGATVAAGNSNDGIAITGGAMNNEIGGTVSSPGSAPGNVISGNSGDGIDFSGAGTSGNLIHGNLIGTGGAGTSALGNGQNGVMIETSAASNTVGGTVNTLRNVISGNAFGTSDGIEPNGAGVTGTNIFGNYIGVDVSGANAISNGEDGILVLGAPSTTIGAATASPGNTGGNVLSGNNRNGIRLEGATASGTIIQGNNIGLRASGAAAQRNVGDGISIAAAPNTTIGGSSATQRNVISGNTGLSSRGIYVAPGGDNTVIQGNDIGTDISGTTAIGNGSHGIHLDAPGGVVPITGIVVGGLTATPGRAPGNVISGNLGSGVQLVGGLASNVTIQGNIIGLNKPGTSAVGNATGVAITFYSGPNLIGGTTTTARNVISGNGTGVAIGDLGSSAGNLVQGNFIGTDTSGMLSIGNGTGVTITQGSRNDHVGFHDADGRTGLLVSRAGEERLWHRDLRVRDRRGAADLDRVSLSGAGARSAWMWILPSRDRVTRRRVSLVSNRPMDRPCVLERFKGMTAAPHGTDAPLNVWASVALTAAICEEGNAGCLSDGLERPRLLPCPGSILVAESRGGALGPGWRVSKP